MTQEIIDILLEGLNDDQAAAVRSGHRKSLVVAGAGSGKTEVMARRIAWWVAVEGIEKERVVALTFMEKAAEEMKFRVRKWISKVTPAGQEVNLGGMYIGTLHGFCLQKLREYWPDRYHNFDILDETARSAFILRGYDQILGLRSLQLATGGSQTSTAMQFMRTYDQLHENNAFEIALPADPPPINLGEEEVEWCRNCELLTEVGQQAECNAFAVSAARYYAHLHCRRFLDFSTSQTEFLRCLAGDAQRQEEVAQKNLHVVVDEVQDINPVQSAIISSLINDTGRLTAVGDHRQSIFGFRGAQVEITGQMWQDFNESEDSDVIDLKENYRSTPRIIQIANRWASSISALGEMETPDMEHGRADRVDADNSHVALVNFDDRTTEADWIAQAVRALVPNEDHGAEHDSGDGRFRGISLSDIAILVRSTTDIRAYLTALEDAGISAVVRGGADLFSQPEVLFFLAALAQTAGVEEFFGSLRNPRSLPNRITQVLRCGPYPNEVLQRASEAIRNSGLSLPQESVDRVQVACQLIQRKVVDGQRSTPAEVSRLNCASLKTFLTSASTPRRVFPQQIYHWLLGESGADRWDTSEPRNSSAMFHLGTLSTLVTSLETPGWTSTGGYRFQIIGLFQYGSREGKAPEQPLLVRPDAVTVCTIHAAKGLEYAAVFLADVNAGRFPSNMARRQDEYPLAGEIRARVNLDRLHDNENYDGERKLMYVALTRAERFLVVSRTGNRRSRFIGELESVFREARGIVTSDTAELLQAIRHAPLEATRASQLSTSFSDMRYYLECPHDFYLRKVLGFAPTIDQAFGYGRGVHNLMRAIHSDPSRFADLAESPAELEQEVRSLLHDGLFYLRYTTGDPADNMREKGIRIVCDYIRRHVTELSELTFEPEKEFETLVEYDDGNGSAMVSGSVDIVRRDDPPRVTLIDFKSGDPDSDRHNALSEREMMLQVGIYAVAAQRELEYEPNQGLVRYLDVDEDSEHPEIEVPLNEASVNEARNTVVRTAEAIQARLFFTGPSAEDQNNRCSNCDFVRFCGQHEAQTERQNNDRCT